MQTKEKNYLFLIAIHVVLGVLVYIMPSLSKLYGYTILFGGIYFVIKTQNRNNEVLYAAAYIVGSEVFLRMTDGNPNHEFSKYGVMLFLGMGMFYSGFSKNAVPYWIFLLLLVPGIIIGTQVLNPTEIDVRKTIMFNISGPLCLGFASLYCYNRRIAIQEVNNILLVMGLPIITATIYIILFTPNLRDVLTGTGSNGATSGGFGPNQVATALGLGMFIFFSRIILVSRTKLFFIINLIIVLNISYRGLLTFSRGGMITGFFMIIILVLIIYANSKNRGKFKLVYLVAIISVAIASIWGYTQLTTSGLIGKRYANEDATGRVKKSQLSGREQIAKGELDMFLSSPFFGIGVAKGTEIRLEQNGYLLASHNELTRMLGEHGSLGIAMLLILFFTPIILYLDNKQHIYMFCFLFFWLLTINHAAMRTAAPSFVYALTLLKVRFEDETPVVHRE